MAKKKGRYTPPFTLTQREAIVDNYTKNGNTLEQLADWLKCSTAKVRKVLLAEKVKMRPRGPLGDFSKPKVKAKKVSKPKAKKVSKPKAKKVSKPKAKKISKPKAKVKAKSKAPVAPVSVPPVAVPKAKGRKELTPEQREAKNAKDRARRAAKSAGLNAAMAEAGQPAY